MSTKKKTEPTPTSGPAVGSSDLLGVRPYKNLGNLSAVEGWASVGLCCDICMVEWVGCWDNAACPQCGDHAEWDKLMEARGYYKAETPNDLSTLPWLYGAMAYRTGGAAERPR